MPTYRVTTTWTDRRTTLYEASKVFEAASENDAREMATDEFYNGDQAGEALGWTVTEEDIHNDEDCFETDVEEVMHAGPVDVHASPADARQA